MKQYFFGLKILASPRRESRSQSSQKRTRRIFLEPLEDRNLLTGMPYGALPDDTGEYMLGDVYVNVVLMESDSSMAPFDTSTENWTSAEIADVKSRIADGLKWWQDTLDNLQDTLPDPHHGLLKFDIDWSHADNPVHTGYEPITRTSQEFANWVYDFLNPVGFAQTGNFLTDIRAFNNAQRLAHNSNWAFTIFVVDDSHDLATDFNDNPNDNIPDYDGAGKFAPGSAFSKSFAYAGGNAFVMPSDRPADIVSHETGHMFWALDEYNTGNNNGWQQTRGYYNTQNTNSSTNTTPGFVQQTSIMAAGTMVDDAYAAHTTSTSSEEMIGWKDSDGDGIFDVLDVPFTLDGTGQYNPDTSIFSFVGKSQVKTLPNKNPSGLQDDITINQIDRAEYSIDGSPWTTAGTYHKYVTDLNLSIPVSPGASQIKIRTVDDRTGVKSREYVANLSNSQPQSSPSPGVSGYVFNDPNGGGTWDPGQDGLPGWIVQLINAQGQPLDLHHHVQPDDYAFGAILNTVASPDATLSAIGGDVSEGNVYARPSSSAPGAGKVFSNNSITDGQIVDTWTASRQLKVVFNGGTTEVNITAFSSGSPSVGRLEIYNSIGQLLDRYTTKVLSAGQSEIMKLVRPQGDIGYAIARGQAGTQVVLDTLEWGPTSSTVSGQFGYYSLPELSGGLYRIATVVKPYYTQSFPSTTYHLINVLDAQGAPNLNFGFIPLLDPWRNPNNALDVNNDSFVSAIDALNVINYINSHDVSVRLPGSRPSDDKFYDVNNDGYVTAVDALMVINELNRPGTPSLAGEGPRTGGGAGTALIAGGSSTGSAAGEGAATSAPLIPGSGLAAQYYAQNPLHVLTDPNTVGCTCAQCQAITAVASGRVSATKTSPPATSKQLSESLLASSKQGASTSVPRSTTSHSAAHVASSLLHTIAADTTRSHAAKATHRRR